MTKRLDWLKERKNYIGGSDISIVCGKNDWHTPLDLYYDKKSSEVKETNTSATERGIFFEEWVARIYSKTTGLKVELPLEPVYHPDYPFLAVNIDRWVYGEDGNISHILECKTANSTKKWGAPGTAEIPKEYLLQVAYQRAIVNLTIPVSHVDIAVMVGLDEHRIYKYLPDLKLEKDLIETAIDFWNNHILTSTPPSPLRNSDFDYLDRLPEQQGVRANSNIKETIRELASIRTEKKYLLKQEDALTFNIKSFMTNNEILLDESDKILATWKFNQPTLKFNTEKFKTEHPELYAQYTQAANSRMLLIKK